MKLAERKTQLVFETSCFVWSQGAQRAVIVEAQPYECVLRLAGSRQSLTLNWAAVYALAAKLEADRAHAEKTATAKTRLSTFHATKGGR
jgi:hypothetical protein